jgi:polyphosphate kinase 2 (PPK2 family)
MNEKHYRVVALGKPTEHERTQWFFQKYIQHFPRAGEVVLFDRRKADPLRQWKLSEVDVQAQERWDEFTNVKYEMLKRTHTTHAPWKIIRSNDKHQARINAIKIILNSVAYERLDDSLDFVPDPNIVISGSRELEMMEAQRLGSGKFLA